jgi:hypothetical protein
MPRHKAEIGRKAAVWRSKRIPIGFNIGGSCRETALFRFPNDLDGANVPKVSEDRKNLFMDLQGVPGL